MTQPVEARPAAGTAVRRGQRAWWVAAVVVTAGAVVSHLTFWQNAGGLWRDEVNSVVLANSPTLREVWANLQYDSFPLLWHLVVRAWLRLGPGGTDGGIRGLGLIAGLGLVAALWRNARRFGAGGGTRVPLVGLVLLGYTSSVVVYGDSIRAYGLGMVMAVLALGAIWDVAEQPTPRRTALALAVALASVHLTFHNSPLLLACCVGGATVAAMGRRWRAAAVVLGIGFVCGASVTVYLPVIARARAYTMMLQLPWAWGRVGSKLQWAMSRLSAPNHFEPRTFIAWVWAVAAGGGVLLAGVTLAVRPAWWRRLPPGPREALIYATLTLLVGTVAYLGFLRVLSYEMQAWYFTGGLALVAGCLDPIYAIACRGWARIALAGAGVVVAGIAFVPTLADASVRMTNVDLMAGALRNSAGPEDVIVTSPWYLAVPLGYYYYGAAPIAPVPNVRFTRYHRYDQLVPIIRDPDALAPTLARLRRALLEGHRVYLLANDIHFYPSHPILAAPSAQFGWSGQYYEAAWRDQLLDTLTSHAVRFDYLASPAGATSVNPFECPTLIRIAGWRDGGSAARLDAPPRKVAPSPVR